MEIGDVFSIKSLYVSRLLGHYTTISDILERELGFQMVAFSSCRTSLNV